MEKASKVSELLAGEYAETAARIKQEAHRVHSEVNQHYDKVLPYSYHLDSVVDTMLQYLDEVLAGDADFLPVYFGAYFHDSIEDARLTYRDITRIAERFMTPSQAFLAAEIVYALTNEKGRTRAERADDRYYAGIRAVPYAPMVKLADRIANMTYSLTHSEHKDVNRHMLDTYRAELPHFLQAITVTDPTDKRSTLPTAMVKRVCELLSC